MRTENELQEMRENLCKTYRKGYAKRNLSEWIATTYAVQTIEWVLGLLDELPAARVLDIPQINCVDSTKGEK
jgi:hypothetical protein